MAGAVAAAAVSGIGSLVGGMLDNKEKRKAANDAFNYQGVLNHQAALIQANLNAQSFQHQIALNDNGYIHQQKLLDTQNHAVNILNDRVERFNRDILDNHSKNESFSTDTVSGSIDFGRLVKDAEAAGFNPLTVLRSGGLAGYSTTATQSYGWSKSARDLMGYFAPSQVPQAPHPGQAAVTQGPQPGQAPQAQVGDAFSNAFSAAMSAYQNYEPDKALRQQLELGIAKAQLDNLNSDTAANQALTKLRLRTPTWTGSDSVASSGGFAGKVNSALGGVLTPTNGKVTVTNAHGIKDAVDPGQNDYEGYETRYGDVLGNIVGVGIAARDAWHYANAKTNNAPNNYTKVMFEAMKSAFQGSAHAPQGYNPAQ